LVLQFPRGNYTRKETDALNGIKRPQGASGMVYEMQRRWNYKSSVDKFYDQDDLSAWAKTTGAKAGILFYLACR
jgi:aspartyl-tRNA synthetase